MMNWFDVDKDGLAKLMAGRPKGFILTELIQNAWDEDATEVTVRLAYHDGQATIVVEDDNPEGFHDLTHAWTLFAESRKKGDVKKRGRFNMGEKLVLALAERATIVTTTGTVRFDHRGRRKLKSKRLAGSAVELVLPMTKKEAVAAADLVETLIPPEGVTTNLHLLGADETALERRKPALTFVEQLATEYAGEDGVLRPTWRKATVELHDPRPGEKAHIYEMGIPVCELDDDRWHVNVLQKVPLNMNRDNVTPAYRKALRVHVLNHAHTLLEDEEQAAASWVKEAAADKRCDDEATGRVLDLRFGKKRAAFDPSDPEANKRAVAAGYTLVTGGALSKGEWANAKRGGAIQPAGKLTPSQKVLSNADGEDDEYPADKVSDDMKRVLAYMTEAAMELLHKPIAVRLANRFVESAAAWYGSSTLSLNVARLGKAWFKRPVDNVSLNALMIHELAHDRHGDHLCDGFHEECCRLGVELALLWRDRPEILETTAADYQAPEAVPGVGGSPR